MGVKGSAHIKSEWKNMKKIVLYVSYIVDYVKYFWVGLFRKIQLRGGAVVSLGENCLTDGILQRHCLKTFTSPYSHGRSNIEYINAIEEDDYKYFFEKDCLRYEECEGETVVRNKYYSSLTNTYDDSVMKGFEFTHHDLINNEDHIKKFNRRVKRMKKHYRNIYLFYHHRYCEETNEPRLLEELHKLYDRYSQKDSNVYVVMFTQIIVNTIEQRKVVYTQKNGIHCFYFYTQQVWEGADNDVFWAKVDDDLIVKMIDFVKKKNLDKDIQYSIL